MVHEVEYLDGRAHEWPSSLTAIEWRRMVTALETVGRRFEFVKTPPQPVLSCCPVLDQELLGSRPTTAIHETAPPTERREGPVHAVQLLATANASIGSDLPPCELNDWHRPSFSAAVQPVASR